MGDFGSSDAMLTFHVKLQKMKASKSMIDEIPNISHFFQLIVTEKQSGDVKCCLHQSQAKSCSSSEKHLPPRSYYEEVEI